MGSGFYVFTFAQILTEINKLFRKGGSNLQHTSLDPHWKLNCYKYFANTNDNSEGPILYTSPSPIALLWHILLAHPPRHIKEGQ